MSTTGWALSMHFIQYEWVHYVYVRVGLFNAYNGMRFGSICIWLGGLVQCISFNAFWSVKSRRDNITRRFYCATPMVCIVVLLNYKIICNISNTHTQDKILNCIIFPSMVLYLQAPPHPTTRETSTEPAPRSRPYSREALGLLSAVSAGGVLCSARGPPRTENRCRYLQCHKTIAINPSPRDVICFYASCFGPKAVNQVQHERLS